MIIERVILENFGSFRGKVPIELEPKGEKNITLLVGHGGAGKTTIGKAIRWALYNRPFHESGRGEEDREYTKEEVLKLFFRAGGGATEDHVPAFNHMSVRLEIQPSQTSKAGLLSHGYKFGKVTLERSADLSGKIIPTARDLILPPLSLKGPDQRDVQDPEGILEEFFLPASTSNFFMFHGDRIRDLTKQIEKPVTEDIKQILDVTAMNNATTDLERVMSHLSRRVSSASKDEATRNSKQSDHERLEKMADRLEKSLHEKEEERKTNKERLVKLEKENQELLSAAGLLKDFESKKNEKKSLEDQRDRIDERLQSLLDSFPREALYHYLYRRAFAVREVDRKNRQHKKTADGLEDKLKQLDQLRPGDKCPLCHQMFPEHMVATRQKEVKSLEEDIKKEKAATRPLDPEFEDLMQTVIRFESLRYNPKELRQERFKLRSQITDCENEMKSIRQKLGQYSEPNVKTRASTITEDIERLSRLDGKLGEGLDKLNEDLAKYKDAMKKLEKELVMLGGKGSETARSQFEVTEKLRNVFADAVVDLADQKRDEIASLTGKMLMDTTIKPDLFHKTAPVDVDDNFQIKAMNLYGRPLEWDVESSSERSLLSLSFIYGLLNASEKEAPVVLDTFFGNLDPNHITKIMERLPEFGPQIVLMTTLTEFDDLIARRASTFWRHVNRYVMLRNSVKTDFVTDSKTLTKFGDAEREAKSQQSELGESKK